MSRIGKKIRTIPAGVNVDINKNQLVVKGPLGELHCTIHPRVTIAKNGNELSVSVVSPENNKDRALWGTFSSILQNMLTGVSVGFKKQLDISGVGYKAGLKGDTLVLEVGYTHPVEVKPLPGIKFAVEKNVITITGVDKQLVGELAAQVRAIKKVEPYKAKGIKYIDEVVRRKAGKTAAKAAA